MTRRISVAAIGALALVLFLAAQGPAAAAEECGKGGYGTAFCPPQPSKFVYEPSRESEARTPEQECEKSGWGIAECFGFGGTRASRGEPQREYKPKPPVSDCEKAAYGSILCPGAGQ